MKESAAPKKRASRRILRLFVKHPSCCVSFAYDLFKSLRFLLLASEAGYAQPLHCTALHGIENRHMKETLFSTCQIQEKLSVASSTCGGADLGFGRLHSGVFMRAILEFPDLHLACYYSSSSS